MILPRSPQNWPSDATSAQLAWLARVRVQPPAGGDLWLPQPDFRPLSAKQKTVALVHAYSIEIPPVGSLIDGQMLTTLSGYATDGASVPKPVQWLTSDPLDPQNLAPYGAGHDPLYGTHYVKRAEADAIAFWLAIANGNSLEESARFRRWLNMLGWIAWQRSPASIAAARKLVLIETKAAFENRKTKGAT